MKSQNTRYSKKFKTISEYINSFPEDTAQKLRTIRKITNKNAPQATEVISYNMPAFKLNGIVVYFAAFKKHVGFYPLPSAIKSFRKELTKYKTSKGAIQFPLDKPLPVALISKIIKYRVKENLTKIRA
ncbi:MAG: hypothetical protein A2653_00355 [Candidatus Zambryskibacteria bacterium RIFCSPHIGHO2_01_FULL_43_25]|uniref:YdhG-like domain-containing protein n=1 Tax=Candidatus Zambryskibacteria bacterium RIFCSPLOWO2_01_FULL_45_21 TaxID=1802761 RepID=A0A1G2U4S2_9BACT|nr:MAG: hypothetical protein A2653_00355 [Candidatus Zambryskibacteria bacterium RIFCSPHIGHO2_01_FULL_43_25]OHB00685.1 MAG: hypothetical protein A3E94_03610 [Candidatus Zambryskibacteria bacterium RIFCSPHIGHO2_12_FULL_44_12b]OHB04496.1 MAG: hypothetical protein A3B14_03650 [Candidatus Zambryskibacteria bacterium RIFCSPLOWO2_01_FULL_45_21]